MSKDSTELLDALTQERYRVVTQNENAYALVILEPLTDCHLMVLPKRLVSSFLDLTAEESKDLLDLTAQMVDAVQKETGRPDCVVMQNNGTHGTINHIHLHIVASDEGIRSLYAAYHNVPERRKATKDELADMTKRLQDKLA